eukprot:1151278-Pelagomonas_calceolata.AAC.2
MHLCMHQKLLIGSGTYQQLPKRNTWQKLSNLDNPIDMETKRSAALIFKHPFILSADHCTLSPECMPCIAQEFSLLGEFTHGGTPLSIDEQ